MVYYVYLQQENEPILKTEFSFRAITQCLATSLYEFHRNANLSLWPKTVLKIEVVFLQQFFKCPYDENCRMDLTNRRFCKHCRLKKCFDIGMKREYIMSDEEKQQKKKKIEENR